MEQSQMLSTISVPSASMEWSWRPVQVERFTVQNASLSPYAIHAQRDATFDLKKIPDTKMVNNRITSVLVSNYRSNQYSLSPDMLQQKWSGYKYRGATLFSPEDVGREFVVQRNTLASDSQDELPGMYQIRINRQVRDVIMPNDTGWKNLLSRTGYIVFVHEKNAVLEFELRQRSDRDKIFNEIKSLKG